MKKFSLSELPPTWYPKEYIQLDTSFVLLFPYTEVSDAIQKIFTKVQISIVYSKTDISSSLLPILPNAVLELKESSSETKNIRNIELTYNSIMKETETLLRKIFLNTLLSYKDMKHYITNVIFPNVRKYPSLFLIPQDFEKNANYLTFDILLRCTLFITALLESPVLNEFSDSQIKMNIAMSAFLSEIGRLQIIKKSKSYITEETFSHFKIQELISRISLAMLRKWHFPQKIIGIVQEIRSFINPWKLNITKKDKITQEEICGQLISIGNYYIKEIHSVEEISPRTVLFEIEKNSNTHFNATLVNNIKQILGPTIPAGTYVKLKNNTYAIALYPSQETHYPIVQVLTDSSNNPQQAIIIISTTHSDFKVLEEVSHKEITTLRKIRSSLFEKK